MDVEDLLMRHECIGGAPNVMPYKDEKGIDTIGIGHNMVSSPLPVDMVPPLKRIQIDQLFQSDLANVMTELKAHLPWFESLDEVRQAVLIDMCFNMGWGGLSQFEVTLGLVSINDYAGASIAMINSQWAKEVPNRAKEDAQMMLTGLWPDDVDFPKE